MFAMTVTGSQRVVADFINETDVGLVLREGVGTNSAPSLRRRTLRMANEILGELLRSHEVAFGFCDRYPYLKLMYIHICCRVLSPCCFIAVF